MYKFSHTKPFLTSFSLIITFSLNYAGEITSNNKLNIARDSSKKTLFEEIKKTQLELKTCREKNPDNTIKCRHIALALSLLSKKYKELYSEPKETEES